MKQWYKEKALLGVQVATSAMQRISSGRITSSKITASSMSTWSLTPVVSTIRAKTRPLYGFLEQAVGVALGRCF